MHGPPTGPPRRPPELLGAVEPACVETVATHLPRPLQRLGSSCADDEGDPYLHYVCGRDGRVAGIYGTAYLAGHRPADAAVLYESPGRRYDDGVTVHWHGESLWAHRVVCSRCRAVRGWTFVGTPRCLGDDRLRELQRNLGVPLTPVLRTRDAWALALQVAPQPPGRLAVAPLGLPPPLDVDTYAALRAGPMLAVVEVVARFDECTGAGGTHVVLRVVEPAHANGAKLVHHGGHLYYSRHQYRQGDLFVASIEAPAPSLPRCFGLCDGVEPPTDGAVRALVPVADVAAGRALADEVSRRSRPTPSPSRPESHR